MQAAEKAVKETDDELAKLDKEKEEADANRRKHLEDEERRLKGVRRGIAIFLYSLFFRLFQSGMPCSELSCKTHGSLPDPVPVFLSHCSVWSPHILPKIPICLLFSTISYKICF